ncbi:MAG: ActS/PrrB/RegB family redox-sensitive histidine kinase [Roseovarius sp.]|nr:ActS/PrrB/RegB family redox-sensitive histidine kinase [Roseovarius sp.]
MSDISPDSFSPGHGRNWIRLRTLTLLRWWAIAGQACALVVAERFFNLDLEMGLCFLVIGVSVASNLVATFVFAETKRLAEQDALLVVLFDMLQLGLLLYLTGGMNNPFSILIVGPVTVSASALTGRSTVFVGVMAIVIVTLLMQFHLPLRGTDGAVLQVPDIFRFGNWVAIVIAVVFLGVYSRRVVQEMRTMSDALQATQMALAREQKLTDLGGVVAAAAHELGTPLATIKLTSAELADDLDDRPDLREDALLIRDQADRCRDILRSMGRAGKDDLHLRRAPLTALVEEAAEPHVDRGKRIRFRHGADGTDPATQPTVLRRPEIIHGLRNLIQNAVDFADQTVTVESRWSDARITLRIMDDGPGFAPDMIGRLGEPFMRRRGAAPDPRRPGYEGMGLGLFIAKTLLERSGADLTFTNGTDPAGALVEISWPRAAMAVADDDSAAGLGENRPISG